MRSAPAITASIPQRAWIEARVFRVAGGRYTDPVTGEERVARGKTWVDGKLGEWVNHGIISDSEAAAGGRAVVSRPPGPLARIWNFIRTLWRSSC